VISKAARKYASAVSGQVKKKEENRKNLELSKREYSDVNKTGI
jgi:hypothetical protein